jgi:hypothetical protein
VALDQQGAAMAHSDELEEFDAELELALKREYSTVYQLFRYCVITQEATYLCNRLDVDCAPQAGYLLFEIAMEDVWVWDRNRPTRIIPRAQVYTTSDVTIEQLKEDDEADLSAVVPDSVIDQLRAGIEDELPTPGIVELREDDAELRPRRRDGIDAGPSGSTESQPEAGHGSVGDGPGITG